MSVKMERRRPKCGWAEQSGLQSQLLRRLKAGSEFKAHLSNLMRVCLKTEEFPGEREGEGREGGEIALWWSTCWNE